MLVSNETVYHTGDLLKIFNAALDSSTPPTYVPKIDLLLFAYSSGTYIGASHWKERLTISLPRKKNLAQKSPLLALASAALPIDDEDDQYCFLAPRQIAKDMSMRVLSTLRRTSTDINCYGHQLRYCDRLKRGQGNALKLGRHHHEIAILKEQKDALDAKVDALEKKIQKANAYNQRSN